MIKFFLLKCEMIFLQNLKHPEVWKPFRKEPCCFADIFFLKFLMIKHDHVWEKWTPDLASKLKLSIDFRSENGSDEFWVRWHTMLWFSTCPSPFPIGVYDTDKHYTTNQSWGQNHYGIVFEFAGDIKGPSFHHHYFSIGLTNQSWV